MVSGGQSKENLTFYYTGPSNENKILITNDNIHIFNNHSLKSFKYGGGGAEFCYFLFTGFHQLPPA